MEAMISRLLEQEEAVRVVLSTDRKTGHLVPTWQDMHVFECLFKALSPISELTDFLSGEYHATISSVIPVLHNLKTKILIAKEEEAELTKDIKKTIVGDLHSRYSNPSIQKLLHTATFLDPRFKADYSNNKEELVYKLPNRHLKCLKNQAHLNRSPHQNHRAKKRRNCVLS